MEGVGAMGAISQAANRAATVSRCIRLGQRAGFRLRRSPRRCDRGEAVLGSSRGYDPDFGSPDALKSIVKET